MEIHIQKNGQQIGPYALVQVNGYLAQGFLTSADFAWHEGLPQWVPLNEIAGVVLTEGVTSVPPPFNQPTAKAFKQGSSKIPIIFAGIGAAAILAVLLVMILGGKSEEQTPEEQIVGEYELMWGEDTVRFAFLPGGIVESYLNDEIVEKNGKWRMVKGGELHVVDEKKGFTFVYTINQDESITVIARISKDGERERTPKEHRVPAKRIK